MPTYSLNHIHHESKDVKAAADWYTKLFDAKQDEPYESGGATWIRAHVGGMTFTITNRADSGPAAERFLGYDHLGIVSDDFDATLARVKKMGVNLYAGPIDAGGFRIAFISGPDNVKIELMEKK